MTNRSNITQMLNQWIKGDTSIEQDLINNLYPLLRDVAHVQLLKSQNASLHTTEVVNELYLNLKKKNRIEFKDKSHFLALSAQLIRRLIIDEYRNKNAKKRGLQFEKITFDEMLYDQEQNKTQEIDWINLNQALIELDKIDSESVKMIELRFFAGLSIPQIAEIFKTSESTVSRNWRFAKSWLINKLNTNE